MSPGCPLPGDHDPDLVARRNGADDLALCHSARRSHARTCTGERPTIAFRGRVLARWCSDGIRRLWPLDVARDRQDRWHRASGLGRSGDDPNGTRGRGPRIRAPCCHRPVIGSPSSGPQSPSPGGRSILERPRAPRGRRRQRGGDDAGQCDRDALLDPITFSPGGDRILFSRTDAKSVTSLWSIRTDGSDAQLLVTGTGWGDWQSLPAARDARYAASPR